jgi:16S rRNA (adenine1518-N6/adenine1519-N6)-dimethyltransferase
MLIRPKKHLGQHFLKDIPMIKNIVEALSFSQSYHTIIEIGPGIGALTQFLLQKQSHLFCAIEIDPSLVAYLRQAYPTIQNHIIEADFLQLNLAELWPGPIAVIGNFPYNVASQILFKLLDARNQVQEVVCMVQKEVAERMIAKPGNKVYGIPSVHLQAFYHIEYLFTVGPTLFNPPPKVESAVIRLQRNNIQQLPCQEATFFRVVRLGFQQRRKKLRNALKGLDLPTNILDSPTLDKRAEQLSINDFISLCQQIDAFKQLS